MGCHLNLVQVTAPFASYADAGLLVNLLPYGLDTVGEFKKHISGDRLNHTSIQQRRRILSNRTNLLHFGGKQSRRKFRETVAVFPVIRQKLLV